jgi:hypothetical protein
VAGRCQTPLVASSATERWGSCLSRGRNPGEELARGIEALGRLSRLGLPRHAWACQRYIGAFGIGARPGSLPQAHAALKRRPPGAAASYAAPRPQRDRHILSIHRHPGSGRRRGGTGLSVYHPESKGVQRRTSGSSGTRVEESSDGRVQGRRCRGNGCQGV